MKSLVNPHFHRSILRVRNRGEPTNSLKRGIYTGGVCSRPLGQVPLELIGNPAPTRTKGIDFRGGFNSPFEKYADQLIPSVL